MHYYQFNIADYRKDTAHLTPIEHYIYRTLIDWYYLDENPIPKETQSVMRRLRLATESEAESLRNVLSDFFIESDRGFEHLRIESDISEYHKKCGVNKENGRKGGRPKLRLEPEKTQSVIFANPNESELNPNHKPLTINHKPILKEKIYKKESEDVSPSAQPKKSIGTRLPENFEMPDEWIRWAVNEKKELSYELIILESKKFIDYWHSAAGAKARKVDWLATWRNWIRGCRAQYPPRSTTKQEMASIAARSFFKNCEALNEREITGTTEFIESEPIIRSLG